jgi:ubiquinol-cytochrome c reductase cytochrome b subunit
VPSAEVPRAVGGAAIWPFFERWVTGDKAAHHINDRPRNVPTRTGIGVAVVVFYGVLWAEGANDVLANAFQVPLYTVTWIARVLVLAGPVAAYVITRRICLGLQRKDARMLEHGVVTGIIRQSPDGEFTEVVRPVTDEERAVLAAPPRPRALSSADASGVPPPAGAGMIARFRMGMNAVYTESAANGHSAANG